MRDTKRVENSTALVRFTNDVTDDSNPPRMSTLALFASYVITTANVFDRLGVGTVRYLAIACVAFYLLLNTRSLVRVIKKTPIVFFAAFIGWVIVSAYANSFRVPGVDIVRFAVIDLVPVLEIGLLVSVYAERGCFMRVVNLFFWWQLVLVSINDFMVLLAPGYFGMESSVLPLYLLGNKFGVVYGHFLMLTLFLVRRNGWNNDKGKIDCQAFVLVSLSLVISLLVDCMTGVIGTVIVYGFNRLISRYPNSLIRPVVLILILLLACSFMFVYDDILNIAAIKFFLADVLNTTNDITGRSQIYEQLPLILKDHLVYGYGYGTCHILGPALGNFVDTQNGLAEWVWRAGIPSVVLICLFLWSCVSHGRKAIADNSPRAIKVVAPLLSYLFTLSVLASVEITVSSAFFIVAFLLASSDCYADRR